MQIAIPRQVRGMISSPFWHWAAAFGDRIHRTHGYPRELCPNGPGAESGASSVG